MIRSIDTQTFMRDYGAVHRGIFSGRPAGYQPFERSEWQVYLLPGGVSIEVDVFQALARSSEAQGDKDFIVTDFETIPPHQVSVVVDWEIYEFKNALAKYPLLHAVDVHMFGKSGTWGMICFFDDFSCLGLTPSQAGIFATELGGELAIKDRFLEFAKRHWMIGEEDKTFLLRSVGWVS